MKDELHRRPRKGGMKSRNEIRAVMASTMLEDELDFAVRGTPKKPGLARRLGFLVYHTRNSIGSDPGFPDLVLIKAGRMITAELKTQKGRLSEEQKKWRDEIQQNPTVEWYLWRPTDWFDGTIERILTSSSAAPSSTASGSSTAGSITSKGRWPTHLS